MLRTLVSEVQCAIMTTMTPAIRSIEVLWAFVIEELSIEVFAEGEPPRHLVLTGPNGSGKSTVLEGIYRSLLSWPNDTAARYRKALMSRQQYEQQYQQAKEREPADVAELSRIKAGVANKDKEIERARKAAIIGLELSEELDTTRAVVAYSPTSRKLASQAARGPSKLAWPDPRAAGNFSKYLLQFLVNRRSEQAFAREANNEAKAEEIKAWFSSFEDALRQLLQEPKLTLGFEFEDFEFVLERDGTRMPFDKLPDGYNSVFAMWSEILLRTEAIEGEAQGWVLIDEPELHLHPELQEQLLPFLTSLFPTLQFIVATHSPIIATSLRNATIYDLAQRSAKKGEDLQGRRYGSVLKQHFGLRTDFDAATTAKLDRLFELSKRERPSEGEQQELRALAGELSSHSHLLAMQVMRDLEA